MDMKFCASKIYTFFYIGKLHMHPIDFEPNLNVHQFLWEEKVPFVSLSAQNLQKHPSKKVKQISR